LIDEDSVGDDTVPQTESKLTNLDQHMYIDLKSQIAVLSHQFSRYESDIKKSISKN
jgi:hypothetical protein